MNNLLRVEFYKLIRNKMLWILVIVLSSLSLLLVLLPYLDEKGVLDKVDQITVEVLDEATEDMSLSGVKIALESLHSPDLFLAVLIISILGAFFISSEYSNGTIKNLVASGYHRWHIYLAKFTVFSIGSVLLVFFTLFIIGVFGTLFFGFGEWPASDMFIKVGKVLFISSLLLVGFSSIVMLFAMTAKSSGISVLLSVGFYFLAGAGLRMLGFKYTLGETLNMYSVYYRYSMLQENSLDVTNMVELSLIAVITSVVFTIAGMLIFQRKDIS